MKNGELQDLHTSITECLKASNEKKFGYALIRNIDKIESKLKEFSSLTKDFEKERLELAEKHALKDADGNPIMSYSNGLQFFRLGKNQSKYNEELKPLRENHNMQGFDDLMDEECDIEFYTIKEDLIPEDLNNDLVRRIKELIIWNE